LCADRLTRIEDFGGKQGSARWRGSLPDLRNHAVLYDISARAATRQRRRREALGTKTGQAFCGCDSFQAALAAQIADFEER
jgi:hypothetical protein